MPPLCAACQREEYCEAWPPCRPTPVVEAAALQPVAACVACWNSRHPTTPARAGLTDEAGNAHFEPCVFCSKQTSAGIFIDLRLELHSANQQLDRARLLLERCELFLPQQMLALIADVKAFIGATRSIPLVVQQNSCPASSEPPRLK